jgi:cyclic pyranopterin phosphate synthase
MQEQPFSHLKSDGQLHMVDVGHKAVTPRTATARAIVEFPEQVFVYLEQQAWATHKGSIRQCAIIAGIMGAKKTSELIPMCHPIGMDHCDVYITVHPNQLHVFCKAGLTSKTGVEMEAMTGATIAALTIYDMCKSLSHEIVLRQVELIEKRGGKSDFSKSKGED